jgi:ubiquinone/menaquinone biosynthesis C-methylase UbiE
MTATLCTALFVALALLVLVGGSRVYNARPRQRVPGVEGLEDEDVAAAFNRVAGWPQFRLLRAYVARRAARLAHAGDGIDLGCGPGHLVVQLARAAPGVHWTGIDLSEEMLTLAAARASDAGLAARVAFKQGNAQAVPFPDASLDAVVSSLSLHHWDDPVGALKEIGRSLRPGGGYLIFDLRRDLPAPSYVLLWFATHVVVPRALRRVGEPLGSRDAAYTPDEAAKLAAEASLPGWRVVAGPLWLIIEGPHGPGGRGALGTSLG